MRRGPTGKAPGAGGARGEAPGQARGSGVPGPEAGGGRSAGFRSHKGAVRQAAPEEAPARPAPLAPHNRSRRPAPLWAHRDEGEER